VNAELLTILEPQGSARASFDAEPGAVGVVKTPVKAVLEAITISASVTPAFVPPPEVNTLARPGQKVPAVAHGAMADVSSQEPAVVIAESREKPGRRSVHVLA